MKNKGRGLHMYEESPDGRAYPRVKIPRPASLLVSVGPLGSRPSTGVPVNISRGGMQARLGVRTFERAEGADCVVRFLEAEDQLTPQSTLGIVRRVEASRGYLFVAIEFSRPLEALNLPDKSANL